MNTKQRILASLLLFLAPFSFGAATDGNEIRRFLATGDCSAAQASLRSRVKGSPATAAYRLALCEKTPRGEFTSEGRRLLQLASDAGNANADYLLYLDAARTGNQADATRWLQRAASRGLRFAVSRLETAKPATTEVDAEHAAVRAVVNNADPGTLSGLDAPARGRLLFMAIQAGREDVARRIAGKDPGPNQARYLTLAINRKMTSLASEMIARRPNAPAVLAESLGLALKRDAIDLVRQLLAAGADPRRASPGGRSVVAYASDTGDIDVHQAFVDHGLDMEDLAFGYLRKLAGSDTFRGASLMQLASLGNSPVFVRRLLAQGESAWSGSPPPAEILYSLHSPVATDLLTEGIPPEQVDRMIDLCIARDDWATLSRIMAGRRLAAPSVGHVRESPLWRYADNPDASSILVDAYSGNLPVDAGGKTLAMHAIEAGNPELFHTLLARGIDMRAVDASSRSAIWFAATWGQTAIMRQLAALTHEIDLADVRGYTPLLLAVAGSRIETARAALELGANVEHRSREGNTALIIAASRSAPLVEILLSHGADPEARNDASNTALAIAAHADCLPCIRSLLDAGAKPGRRNSQGKQARDLTTDPVVLKLLQDRG